MNIFRELREQHGLTQRQLAEELHVCQQTVAYYENGKRFPIKPVLQHMSAFYGVSTDYLIGTTNIKTPPDKIKPYELDESEVELIEFLRLYPGKTKSEIIELILKLGQRK